MISRFVATKPIQICKNSRPPAFKNPPFTAMPTITKRELAIKITDQLGTEGHSLSQQDVMEVIQRLIVVVADSLADGDQVLLGQGARAGERVRS